jgi:hypothetical protein
MRISETFNGKLSDAAHQLRMIIAASNAQNYREAQSRQSIADDTWAIGRLKDGLEIIPDNYEKMINLLEQICISISLDCSIRGLAKEFGLSVRQAQNFTRCFKKFNPEVIKAVSTVHKKWKVAYDALSETGINIGG